MDKLLNPFSPGAGTPPPELAGRQEILEAIETAFIRVKNGFSEKSLFLVGLRGVGKTVLLNKIESIALEQNYLAVMIEAHEGKTLPALLIPHLRSVLLQLDTGEFVSAKVKKGLRILKSFFNGVKVTIGDVELGIDIEPEVGIADSGDLETDLTALFVSLGEAAQEKKRAIALIIDELQYLSESELSALIMAVHKINQKKLPLIVVGAGLPQLVGNAGKSKSYAERLFDYPPIGPLSVIEASQALEDPVTSSGVTFTKEALSEIIKMTQGYPYFLQEWGYQAWNLAPTKVIDLDVAKAASKAAISRLDTNFFRVRFDRLTPREKTYLRALAELGNESQRSGDIAQMLGTKSQSVAPLRDGLIKKGMIFSPQHGETSFTVPLFAEFMIRTMPDKPTALAKRD